MLEPEAVPERFRSVLSAAVGMIADGDVAALHADPGIRVGESDPLARVQAYPGSVIRLPPEAWRAADAMRSGKPQAKALRGAGTLDSSFKSCCGISAARRKRHDGRRA